MNAYLLNAQTKDNPVGDLLLAFFLIAGAIGIIIFRSEIWVFILTIRSWLSQSSPSEEN